MDSMGNGMVTVCFPYKGWRGWSGRVQVVRRILLLELGTIAPGSLPHPERSLRAWQTP